MRSVGIAVHLPKKGRPAAKVVVLDGDWDTPSQVDAFELTSANEDLATQLLDLAAGLRSRLNGINPDRVVIRRADFAQRGGKTEGPRIRLLAEGALASAARAEVGTVLVQTGKDLAAGTPAGTKANLDQELVNKLPSGDAEASAAALVGLVP
jgi:hypothetical protein